MDLTDLTLMGETSWFLVHFNLNEETKLIAKSHYVHKCLLSSLIVDLETRGYSVNSIDSVDTINLDLGGIIMTGMPMETIRLDLVDIQIWSHQALGIVDLMLCYSDQPRSFKSKDKYYKVHHWGFCTVFTVDQRNALLEALIEMGPAADARADIFIEAANRKNKKD